MLDYKNDWIYAVGRPEIRKEIPVSSFDVATLTFWNDILSAFGDTVIPVMVSVIGAVMAILAFAVTIIGRPIATAFAVVVVNDVPCILALPPEIVGVNTSDGNVILTVSLLANACEIFIIIVKVPVVHTAELP